MSGQRAGRICARTWLACSLSAACGEQPAAPLATQAALPAGVAARVGAEDIRAESVARIARAQSLDLVTARERAVSDALFAALARSDPARRADVSSAERAVLGRAVAEMLREQARARGPATDEELSKLTAERWVELDRPESVRVAHAVVRVEKNDDEAKLREFAGRLAKALQGAPNGDELIRRAQAFPAEGHTVTAERLPPCTADGRTWEPSAQPPAALTAQLDLDFTRAAHALKTPGEQSAPVRTAFGYHVIQLEERYPEARIPLETRRTLLFDALIALRAKPEYEALIARLQKDTPVSVERAADELTAKVPTGTAPVAP
jgi:parvulin-like peptidyl-prolyl isomerase